MTELGTVLKEARESKGLTLEELQSITKIQKRYLLGIEEGNYSMMPGKFYVRAFIKQYAEAVGLEPEGLFDQYKSEIPSTYNEELPEKLSRVTTRKSISPDSSKFLDTLPKILIGIFIISAFALVWYLIVKNADDDVKDEVSNGTVPPTYEEKKVEEENQDIEEDKSKDENDNSIDKEQEDAGTPAQELNMVSAKGSNTVYELKNSDKFVVKIVSLGRTWVSVKNQSGKTFFGEELKKGIKDTESADLTNDTQALINVGFAPDTEIYVNDQKLEYAVTPSEVMTQKITINFVK